MSSIYQVGKQQLASWIDSHSVHASSVDDLARVQRGGYVVVYMVARFGHMLPGPQVSRFFMREDIATEYLRKCQELRPNSTTCRAEYELWQIVDDADLWQVWDMEADAAAGDVLAAEAMEAVFGVDKYIQAPRCIVCEDAKYGPWVTVALKCGSRYMCVECYDDINTARRASGIGPLRIARCYS